MHLRCSRRWCLIGREVGAIQEVAEEGEAGGWLVLWDHMAAAADGQVGEVACLHSSPRVGHQAQEAMIKICVDRAGSCARKQAHCHQHHPRTTYVLDSVASHNLLAVTRPRPPCLGLLHVLAVKVREILVLRHHRVDARIRVAVVDKYSHFGIRHKVHPVQAAQRWRRGKDSGGRMNDRGKW